MIENTKEYLGDGVYADFDGYHIVLSAERDGFMNTIFIEPEVMASLLNYAKLIESRQRLEHERKHREDLAE